MSAALRSPRCLAHSAAHSTTSSGRGAPASIRSVWMRDITTSTGSWLVQYIVAFLVLRSLAAMAGSRDLFCVSTYLSAGLLGAFTSYLFVATQCGQKIIHGHIDHVVPHAPPTVDLSHHLAGGCHFVFGVLADHLDFFVWVAWHD